jgi:Mg2+ and Co2+ transporter CorA
MKIELEIPNELEVRIQELRSKLKSNPTIEALCIDLIDDVVDVWLENIDEINDVKT